MKLIKIFFCLLTLSSCNKYLGTLEPDYVPVNEVTNFLQSNINLKQMKGDIVFKKIKYPSLKNINDISYSSKIEKIISLDSDSVIYANSEEIFLTKKGSVIRMNENNFKIEFEYNLDLDKDENIILIEEYNETLLILSNKLKLFKLNQDTFDLVLDYETFINSNPIILDNNILVFSVFGEILHISLDSNTIEKKGKFADSHGTSLKSNSYLYDNLRSHLFNSGTLIFIDKLNYELQSVYFLEDLNILTSLDLFDELIDAPFEFEQHLYFIDKKGLISVFNPITSNILWEVNINSVINDYLFSEDGNLYILSNNKILILNKEGSYVYDLVIDIENPSFFLMNLNEFFVFNSDGIVAFDLNSKKQNKFIKSKFYGQLDLINTQSNIFIKDNKSLYKISE